MLVSKSGRFFSIVVEFVVNEYMPALDTCMVSIEPSLLYFNEDQGGPGTPE